MYYVTGNINYFFRMKKNLVEIVEGTFAIAALFSVIAISILGVTGLNPKEYIAESFDPISLVAGAQTNKMNQEATVTAFEVTKLSIADYPQTSLLNSVNDYKLQHTFLVNFPNTSEGSISDDFLKIENPNEFDDYIYVKTLITGNLQDNVKITIQDGLDDIILYGKNYREVERRLTIPGKSSKTYKITYEFSQNINFPFQITFTLNQKDLHLI